MKLALALSFVAALAGWSATGLARADSPRRVCLEESRLALVDSHVTNESPTAFWVRDLATDQTTTSALLYLSEDSCAEDWRQIVASGDAAGGEASTPGIRIRWSSDGTFHLDHAGDAPGATRFDRWFLFDVPSTHGARARCVKAVTYESAEENARLIRAARACGWQRYAPAVRSGSGRLRPIHVGTLALIVLAIGLAAITYAYDRER